MPGLSVALLFAGFETSIGNAQETPEAVEAGWRVDPVVKNPFKRLPTEGFGQEGFSQKTLVLLGSWRVASLRISRRVLRLYYTAQEPKRPFVSPSNRMPPSYM